MDTYDILKKAQQEDQKSRQGIGSEQARQAAEGIKARKPEAAAACAPDLRADKCL